VTKLPGNPPAARAVPKYSRTPLIRIKWDDEPHPNMQKFRIIGFSCENKLRWQFEVTKISTNVLVYIFIHEQTKY
jgi:hypothetical protein